jgi:hypothetical protein
MNKTRSSRWLTLTTLAVLDAAFSSSIMLAQSTPPPDTFKVNYFSNANTTGAPDGTVQITSPGTSPGNAAR